MARSGGTKGVKKGDAKSTSLVSLAKSLDTRKREAPVVSTRDTITAALRSKTPVPVAAAVKVPAAVRAPVPVPVPVAAKVASLPPKFASPPSSTLRTAALSSLQKSPSLPGKLPVANSKPIPKADVRRQYPRADIHVKARLTLADDPSRFFEAALPTVNLSVGGMFLESSFFLKMGTKLLIELDLPQRGRSVKVKGEVVRIETNATSGSGFALRFTEYLDGSQVTLATHFLSPVLKEFLAQYAKEHRFDASAEYLAHTADVLAAWELKKAELGGDVWDLFSARA